MQRSARGPLSAAVFYITCILLSPILLAGYVLWSVSLLTGRKTGVSGTAQAPLNARWFMHQLGVRKDAPANRLMQGIASLPFYLTMGPLVLAHRVSGYVPPAFRYPFAGEMTMGSQGAARQTFYDQVAARYLPHMAQFVILGAGFDTRALNLPDSSPVRAFEIDTPATQAYKRAMLAKTGVDAARVTFVPANFETEDWLALLIRAGFDPEKPALFIWEGVTPYLERVAVEDTLRKIASTATGSVVAFDYFSSEVLESQALSMRAVRASLKAGGEPLKFGVDSTPPLRERVAELLQTCGLSLIEQQTIGPETNLASQPRKRALGGFAVAAR